MGRIEATAPGSRLFSSPRLEGIPDWVVSSRLRRPGAAQRCFVGVEGVAPGWGAGTHLGPDSQQE